MSCRTGPLRVARPLRGVYTLLWQSDMQGGLPLVGMIFPPTNERTHALDLSRLVKKACERPHHAQWARPAGHAL
jgi:hypothetical protein